jgi:hypothetical protein
MRPPRQAGEAIRLARGRCNPFAPRQLIAGARLQEPAMKGVLAWLIGIPIPIIIILYLLDVF